MREARASVHSGGVGLGLFGKTGEAGFALLQQVDKMVQPRKLTFYYMNFMVDEQPFRVGLALALLVMFKSILKR